MFLKSKYDNATVNVSNVFGVDKSEFEAKIKDSEKFKKYYTINFLCNQLHIPWEYESEEERDTEYDWVLSQLDYRVNDGEPDWKDELIKKISSDVNKNGSSVVEIGAYFYKKCMSSK